VGPVPLESLVDFSQLQHDPKFDFWKRPQLGENLIMTSSDNVASLKSNLDNLNLEYTLYIPDVAP